MSAFFDGYEPVTVASVITNSRLPFGAVMLSAPPMVVLSAAPVEYLVMMSGSAALPFERDLQLPRPLPVCVAFSDPVPDTTAGEPPVQPVDFDLILSVSVMVPLLPSGGGGLE